MNAIALKVIDAQDVKQVRSLLKQAGIKATVRKGRGSLRCTITITTAEDMMVDEIDAHLQDANLVHAYVKPVYSTNRFYYQVPA